MRNPVTHQVTVLWVSRLLITYVTARSYAHTQRELAIQIQRSETHRVEVEQRTVYGSRQTKGRSEFQTVKLKKIEKKMK